MRVRYTPRASSDLEAILQYIDQRSPLGARKAKRAIQKTIELVGNSRKLGGGPVSKQRECYRRAATHT